METTGFDIAWERFTGGREPAGMAPELVPLLRAVYEEIARRPTDPASLKKALHHLLSFLASAGGRTDGNCRTTDFFLCLSDDVDWDHVPSAFADILGDMAGALHDSVSSPDVALNCESTPEQLLKRLSTVQSDGPAV